ILSQQLGWWVSRAPELEEDMALANITLDLLGHARALLHYAGSGSGKSEDELAYFRDEPEFRCCWLVQQPNGHFGDTIARQLVLRLPGPALRRPGIQRRSHAAGDRGEGLPRGALPPRARGRMGAPPRRGDGAFPRADPAIDPRPVALRGRIV